MRFTVGGTEARRGEAAGLKSHSRVTHGGGGAGQDLKAGGLYGREEGTGDDGASWTEGPSCKSGHALSLTLQDKCGGGRILLPLPAPPPAPTFYWENLKPYARVTLGNTTRIRLRPG